LSKIPETRLKIYFSGGIVVGCLILVDAVMIFNGYQYFINQIFSIIELCWFVYSLVELYYGMIANRHNRHKQSFIEHGSIGHSSIEQGSNNQSLNSRDLDDQGLNNQSSSKRILFSQLAYVIYYMFGFFIGSIWLVNNGNLAVVPDWYIIFAMLFGIYYSVTNFKLFKGVYFLSN